MMAPRAAYHRGLMAGTLWVMAISSLHQDWYGLEEWVDPEITVPFALIALAISVYLMFTTTGRTK